MNTQEILDVELGPTQSVMAVINESGDKKTIWDRNDEVEVEAARKEFNHFRAKGYMAYKVEGKDGKKGTVLHEFDPEAERMIFCPAMKGGN